MRLKYRNYRVWSMIKTLFLFIWQGRVIENSIIRSWLPGHKF